MTEINKFRASLLIQRLDRRALAGADASRLAGVALAVALQQKEHKADWRDIFPDHLRHLDPRDAARALADERLQLLRRHQP